MAMETRISNEVNVTARLNAVALLAFSFTLWIHGGEKVDSEWKQMKFLLGSELLNPQKPLLFVRHCLQLEK